MTLRINKIRIPKLTDRQATLKKVDAALDKLWKGAIRAFVFAAANRVRIQTGMARASILPLARFVRVGLAISQDITTDARTGKNRRLRYNGPEGGFRSKTRGEREFGPQSFNRDVDVTIERGILRFEFRITVFQWAENEDNWRALDAGRSAFEQYIDANNREFTLEVARAVTEGISRRR